MPLPADEHVVETSKGLVDTLHGIFGPHPGFRPAHAKGILLKGTFTPTAEAGKLSMAQHFNEPSTPVIARFSNSTGLPDVSDASPNAQPNGFALRFQLASHPRRKHTDIIGHSVDGFPGSNGDEALAFFRALKDGEIESYLGTHPKALAFVQAPKPFPESFATQRFFSVNAFKLVDAGGKGTFVRYRIEPAVGLKTLSAEEVASKAEDYLFSEVPRLLGTGPIKFRLTVQVAEEGDVTDDCCVHWPEERQVVELGTINLEGLVEDDAAEQKQIIFDPIPRDVPGVEPSGDPLLDVRAAMYLISGRERRAA
ncbi:heme-dependent catalase [Cryphonectria parasitica EP155]|uniref:Heme-dependent catalase n=1 Tax=Cryphonectria parasitica (strain ATCC 38755 / EP155) TaxID=660469 RepID=A0A9P4Y6Q7_CRYP1|nr:heme-dependent catalase [Cryphonectria parasitica EP155]KAF3767501.1 heme-dependent catalase [Cryphonectria parasitica EP155]